MIEQVYNLDARDFMRAIPAGIADMILCDLPFGVTRNEWDVVIPYPELWEGIERIIKPNGAILLHAQPPFNVDLASSKRSWYRYDHIWGKNLVTGFLNANRAPLKSYENVCVFYDGEPTYNPQMEDGHKPYTSRNRNHGRNYGKMTRETVNENEGDRFPRDLIFFDCVPRADVWHPTEKPVEMERYFIRTYSNPGEVVVDMTCGSGTTAVAAKLEKRSYIVNERNKRFHQVVLQRLAMTRVK